MSFVRHNAPISSLSLRFSRPVSASRAAALSQQLKRFDNVENVTLEAPYDAVDIQLASQANLGDILDMLAGDGLQLERSERDFRIGGMYCAACTVAIEHRLNALPEVESSSVNLATGSATVTAIDGFPTSRIDNAIRAAGYKPLGKQSAQTVLDDALRERRALGFNALLAAILALPIICIEMGRHVLHDLNFWLMFTPNAYWKTGLVMCVLAGIIQFGPGLRFYRHGFPALWRGSPNMDSLVMLGSTAAWGYSTLVLFVPSILPPSSQLLYFESSSVIITLVLFGRYLEAIARGHTSQAIARLVALKPKRALRIQADNEHEIKVEDVQRGDVLRVLPGERLPVDGELLDASAYLDQSMITGESLPVYRCRGDALISGSINRANSFVYRATDVGERSSLAQIIRLVQRAQNGKLPIQSLADRITYRFVPLVITIAVATLIIWLSVAPPEIAWLLGIVGAISVLIISCPCAMGLATPTSVMVASGEASKMGVLFQRGAALQTLSEIDYALFDKTGTLTQGHPDVKEFIALAGNGRETLRMAASLEQHSEHPLGAAIMRAAAFESLSLKNAENVESRPGEGIHGVVEQHEIVIGGQRAMHNAGVDITASEARADKAMQDGLTVVYIAVDSALAAMVIIGDTLLPMAARTIVALEQRGIVPVILSGDDPRTVAAIARQLGISNYTGSLTPDNKRAEVERLQAQGHKTAFIGDGINDAPALATAQVGVAIGRGTDIAIEAADVILVTHDLGNLMNAIALSHTTMRNIRQNLAWAFGYNILCIPLAAGLYYAWFEWMLSPEAAAFVMALSSLFVMFNALRLKHFKPGFISASNTALLALGERPLPLMQAAELLGISRDKAMLWATSGCFTTPLHQPLDAADINRLCCLFFADQLGMDIPSLVSLLTHTVTLDTPLTQAQQQLAQQFAHTLHEASARLNAARAIVQNPLQGEDPEACEDRGSGKEAPTPDTLTNTAKRLGIAPAMLNYYTELGMLSRSDSASSISNQRRLVFIDQARVAGVELKNTRRILLAMEDQQDVSAESREAILIHLEAFNARQNILMRAQNVISEIVHSVSHDSISSHSAVAGARA